MKTIGVPLLFVVRRGTVCFSGIFRGVAGRGVCEQQFATQTLRVHLLGIEGCRARPSRFDFFIPLGLSRFLWDFPDRSGDFGYFPDFAFSSFSSYQQHLRGTVPKKAATQSGPFPKRANPPVWRPPRLVTIRAQIYTCSFVFLGGIMFGNARSYSYSF